MSDLPHYFDLSIEPISIRIVLYLTLLYYLYSDLFFSYFVFSYANFAECSCSDLFAQYKIMQTFFIYDLLIICLM